jgi:hypothetical protein
MESRDEHEAAQEAAARAELVQLSQLSAAELIERIERGTIGPYHQAFAALAAKQDVRLAAPFLLRQLQGKVWTDVDVRASCVNALLSLLPYAGLPWHALADRRHRGHVLYMEDLAAHVEKSLRRLG